MIRNGSTFRIVLVPSFHNIIVTLSGAQAPGQRREVVCWKFLNIFGFPFLHFFFGPG